MTTVNKIEIEKFSKLAHDWWTPNGKFKPLHLFNSSRLEYIKEKLNLIAEKDERTPRAEMPWRLRYIYIYTINRMCMIYYIYYT